eukprot:2147890-Amphidinium_carterae.1
MSLWLNGMVLVQSLCSVLPSVPVVLERAGLAEAASQDSPPPLSHRDQACPKSGSSRSKRPPKTKTITS